MPFSYSCLFFKQRQGTAPKFCLLHAPAGEILQWAAIKRLGPANSSPQRRENLAKVKGVSRFFQKDDRNTIPSAVILSLNIDASSIQRLNCEGLQSDGDDYLGTLSFECTPLQMPGLVIDGQHRLLGMNAFSPTIHVSAIVLLNVDDPEIAFQFLVINNKASKVEPDHIKALALRYDETRLVERLKSARMTFTDKLKLVGLIDADETSPFFGALNWPINPEERALVAPSAIEASIAYIQQEDLKDFDDTETLLDFFFAIWRAIKQTWTELWVKDSRLLEKVGVICLTQYLADNLIVLSDLGVLVLSDADQVKSKTIELLSVLDKRFWTTPWTSTSYDTKAGREMVLQNLKTMGRNVRHGGQWFEDLTLIDMSQLGNGAG